MKLHRFAALLIFCGATDIGAMEPFVPPPGPQIVDGDTIEIQREVFGSRHIVHMKRVTAAPFTQLTGDYLVELDCAGDNPIRADLRTWTSPRGAPNEEIVFLTIPPGHEDKCTLTVLSRARHPWTRVFTGLLSSIPKI